MGERARGKVWVLIGRLSIAIYGSVYTLGLLLLWNLGEGGGVSLSVRGMPAGITASAGIQIY